MTTARLIELFYFSFTAVFPSIILVILACRSFLRFSLPKTLLLSVGSVVLHFLCMTGYELEMIPYIFVNLMFLLIYIVFAILLTTGSKGRTVFILSMVVTYGSVYNITGAGIFFLLGINWHEYGYVDASFALAVAVLFCAYYYWILCTKLKTAINDKSFTNSWNTLWLLPFFFCLVHFLYVMSFHDTFSRSMVNVCILIIMDAGSAFICFLVVSMIGEHEKRRCLEAENEQLIMLTAQFNTLKEKAEETRQARHDLRQHLRLISSYLDNGDEAALKDYIRVYGQSLPEDIDERFCQNNIADTIIRYYAQKAKDEKIHFDTKLDLPYTIGIPNSDLCVLLGNLLENALEACIRHKSEDSFIKLNARPVGSQMLVITVDNGYVEKPRAKQNGFVSAKRDGLGTGVYSVRRIAESHNGEALFEWKDGVFYASITMKY